MGDDDDCEPLHRRDGSFSRVASDIRTYLAEREARRTRGTERGAAATLLRRASTWQMRQSAKVHATTFLAPRERRRAERFVEEGRSLRIHLGSGTNRLPDWVNVDLVGMRPDLYWNVTRTLPFPDGSADAVFLEHVLEHFPLAVGLDLLAESRRLLAPGGILRVGVPDFGRYAESYAGDRAFLEERRPGRPTPLLAFAEVAYDHGHRSVWDGETLELVLRETGLVEVGRRGFGDSDLDPAPDSAEREAESVYAEGRTPA
jgi:SAM-dependent methyltransferase